MKVSRRIIFLGLIIISAIVFLVKVALEENRPHSLPRLGKVPAFYLQDSAGRDFYSPRELKDKVWIADFFYTSCASPCGKMSENMAKLSRTFAAVEKVALVSVTIFPESDPPPALEDYKSRFKTGGENWFFLTGDKAAIRQLACDSFRLIKPGGPIAYGPYLVLVDRDSVIRGYYDATNPEAVNRLFRDTIELVRG